MDFKPSPYLTTQFLIWTDHILRGNRKQAKNSLGWERIVLNIPRVDDYNSIKHRVYEQTVNGTMVADDIVDIDDLQTMGGSETIFWDVIRQIAARFNCVRDSSCS